MCRVAGITAILVAPMPSFVLLYKLLTTKVNDMSQEDLAYHGTNASALALVAVLGFVIGRTLLFLARQFRLKAGKLSASS
jgi:hypothetical protein